MPHHTIIEHVQICYTSSQILIPLIEHQVINPFKPEFINHIIIDYKNGSSNSRIVVDEDDLKWGANDKKVLLLLKQCHDNYRSKTPGCS